MSARQIWAAGVLDHTDQPTVEPAVELGVLGVERRRVYSTIMVVDRVSCVPHRQLRDLTTDPAHMGPRPVVMP